MGIRWFQRETQIHGISMVFTGLREWVSSHYDTAETANNHRKTQQKNTTQKKHSGTQKHRRPGHQKHGDRNDAFCVGPIIN
jgi:hypothetical protein